MQSTMWVGIAAIVAASLFNVLTLRRSGKTLALAELNYQRTEERYQDDLLDRRIDVLRRSLIEVSVAVAEYNQANAWYVKLLNDFGAGAVKAGELQRHDRETHRPAVLEVYRTCQIARFAAYDDRYGSTLHDIETVIAEASALISSHDPRSHDGIVSAAAEFTALRERAAHSAGDLIRTAHEALAPNHSSGTP